MNCAYCGAVNKPDAKYCAVCGKVVIDKSIAPFDPAKIVLFISSSHKQIGPLTAEEFLKRYKNGEITDIDFLLGKDKKWKQWSQVKGAVATAMPAMADVKPKVKPTPSGVKGSVETPPPPETPTPQQKPPTTAPRYGGAATRPGIPGENTSLVLGTISIVLGLIPFVGFIGVIMGIIGLVVAVSTRNKAEDKGIPKEQVAKGGFICSIIGLCLSLLWSLCWVTFYFVV